MQMKKTLILAGIFCIGFASAQEKNVGIGIENPTEKLDINGDIKVRGLQLSNDEMDSENNHILHADENGKLVKDKDAYSIFLRSQFISDLGAREDVETMCNSSINEHDFIVVYPHGILECGPNGLRYTGRFYAVTLIKDKPNDLYFRYGGIDFNRSDKARNKPNGFGTPHRIGAFGGTGFFHDYVNIAWHHYIK